jgi:urease gamma subunit
MHDCSPSEACGRAEFRDALNEALAAITYGDAISVLGGEAGELDADGDDVEGKQESADGIVDADEVMEAVDTIDTNIRAVYPADAELAQGCRTLLTRSMPEFLSESGGNPPDGSEDPLLKVFDPDCDVPAAGRRVKYVTMLWVLVALGAGSFALRRAGDVRGNSAGVQANQRFGG